MKTKKFQRLSPHLPVRNLRQTLAYYRDVLGFTDEWTFGETDGGIRKDDMWLLFGENPRHTEMINNPSNRLPLLWFVDNIEEVYAEFLERNIELADHLREHPYGMKEFAFIDINGYYIRVSEPK